MVDHKNAVLALDGQQLEQTLFRIQKGTTLEFKFSPKVNVSAPTLWSNYPINGVFSRTKFDKIEPSSGGALQIEVKIAGSFDFHYGQKEDDPNLVQGSFVVDPEINLPFGQIPLNSINIQTVMPRCLGSFQEWIPRLKVSSESGYNMIHFTPVQEIGQSNSAYSLKHQLRIEPRFDPKASDDAREDGLREKVGAIHRDLKMGTVVDVVWNHTATDSDWVVEHPEACYNLKNSPHLRPAFVLDEALQQASLELSETDHPFVENDGEVDAFLNRFFEVHYKSLKLWEFYVVNVPEAVQEFREMVKGVSDGNGSATDIMVKPNSDVVRNGTKVDFSTTACKFYLSRNDCEEQEAYVERCVSVFRTALDALNMPAYITLDEHMKQARENLRNAMIWQRVNPSGPRKGKITPESPLPNPFFARLPGYLKNKKKSQDQCILEQIDGEFIAAHNGWIWNADPLVDFASTESNAYLRRDVIVWDDSIKLNYGKSPDHNPFLWEFMSKYTAKMASIFDGLRIDNCHSTPLHVGQYLVDVARKEKPDLYVLAELFTGDEAKDNMFTNKLGITTIIREALQADGTRELSRLIHRYGGSPIGTFSDPIASTSPLFPSPGNALFMDCTHDNETPSEKYTLESALPISAIVAMTAGSSGSVRGYDELVQTPVKVVGETRGYRSWSTETTHDTVSGSCGIIKAKRALNALHARLGEEGYTELYVDHVAHNVITVTRHNPKTLQMVLLISHTAYHLGVDGTDLDLTIHGEVSNVILAANVKDHHGEGPSEASEFVTGANTQYSVTTNVPVDEYKNCSIRPSGHGIQKLTVRMDPGSVLAVGCEPTSSCRLAMTTLSTKLGYTSPLNPEGKAESLPRLKDLLNSLSLVEMNELLYRCPEEEASAHYKGDGGYDVPNFGKFTYCGIQGLMSVFEDIIKRNDLAHPVCQNLRSGNWLMEYTANRLKENSGTKNLGEFLDEIFKLIGCLPRSVVPCHFVFVVSLLYRMATERCIKAMSTFIQNGSELAKKLALCSVQLYGKDAKFVTNEYPEAKPSLAAGLPHFSGAWARSWGRDTFIAIRGHLMVTGRFAEAKDLILLFASCLRHGLIPNLLDGGNKPRYNCRDAAWWFLEAIHNYCDMAKEGTAILDAQVQRRFCTDDEREHQSLRGACKSETLASIIQEIMERHGRGISYREWNAGDALDRDMHHDGFNVTVSMDRETGFISGGNPRNCGTWMDKMGSSEKAGNKGFPGSPRDGADIEIIGLLKSTVGWLARLYDEKKFKHKGITGLTYADWDKKLKESFEKNFWIPQEPSEDRKYNVETRLIHKRGIYKDTVGSAGEFTDYQLRPNQCIAMAVAPDMFDPDHARSALAIIEQKLLGPLGMKTLDPDDWVYRGNYNNSDDSTDRAVAQGFNYHQGPEWLWPVGYFMRAKYIFAADKEKVTKEIQAILVRLDEHLESTPWKGLTELTNENGSHCHHSCPTQAWSSSCVLDALYDMWQDSKST